MTTGQGNLESADDAWREMRSDTDIQFEPIPPEPPAEPPGWLKDLGEWLESLFGPMGEGLAGAWPVLKWVLLAIFVAAVAYAAWLLIRPYLERPDSVDSDDAGWQPERAEALALLEDADRLAETGDYDAAVQLLLDRSVGQIAAARPELVEPSSTARELSGITSLPEQARAAFGVIATSVERSLFALQKLGQDDWQKARGAYADFALERLT